MKWWRFQLCGITWTLRRHGADFKLVILCSHWWQAIPALFYPCQCQASLFIVLMIIWMSTIGHRQRGRCWHHQCLTRVVWWETFINRMQAKTTALHVMKKISMIRIFYHNVITIFGQSIPRSQRDLPCSSVVLIKYPYIEDLKNYK